MILSTAKTIRKLGRLFFRKEDGVASIEFTILAPVMIAIYFGTLELSDAMLAHRKVGSAVNMMSDLVSRESTMLEHNELQGMYTAINKVIEPYGIDNASMWVASITMDEENVPRVDWSIEVDWSGDTPALSEKFTRDSVFSAISEEDIDMEGELALMDAGSSLIVSYIEYPFVSSLSNMIATDSIVFKRYAVRWPRYISKIKYCDEQGACSS